MNTRRRLNIHLGIALSATLLGAGCSSGSKPADGAKPGPKAYVGLFGDSTVAVIDTGRNQVTKTTRAWA